MPKVTDEQFVKCWERYKETCGGIDPDIYLDLVPDRKLVEYILGVLGEYLNKTERN